ncbi:MAG TPA: hypothetical protein VGC65_09305 [Bacteroidia bacterium]
MMKTINKENLKGLKYYLSFTGVVLTIYLFSMFTGYRFLSFNESSHSKERAHTRTYYHK